MRRIYLLGLLTFGWLLMALWVAWPTDNLKIVICDVGQGDAVLVKRRDFQMLIDGGPDNKVLSCLGRHVPFWDRKIEFVSLSHPQADHLNGLIEVFRRYEIEQVVMPPVENNTEGYEQLRDEIRSEGIIPGGLYSGDVVRAGEIEIWVVWPERGWVGQNLGTGEDLNSYSLGLIVDFGSFQMLTSGDADTQVEDEMLAAGFLRDVDVLKVPHHGSKTGMSAEWLERVDPEIAVISVGDNSYGHPTDESLRLLNAQGAKIYRTDLDGDVVIETDGDKYWVD